MERQLILHLHPLRVKVTGSSLFNLVSLGCPKNRVDSERILSVMTRAGFAHTEDICAAQVIIINTCAFIEPAVEESVEVILDSRAENEQALLVVAGCLPLRYGESLRKALREADLFVKPDNIPDMPGLVREAMRKRFPLKTAGASKGTGPRHGVEIRDCQPWVARVVTTPGYAYLRVAEGCSRSCRYCTIPSIRGPFRSVAPDSLEQEVRFLAAAGARELVLVAQDLTGYGIDRREKSALVKLLKRISRIEGIRWIRLMYLHPEGIPKDLPALINETENILPYLDIPFQHVSQAVLAAMGRPWKGDRIRDLVHLLRDRIPGLVLRTTLMVGFPGEGEKEFAELRQFVQSMRIEHVGVFSYSPEEGTAAWSLGDPVPPEVKTIRADEIRNIHVRFAEERGRPRIGSVEDALVEGLSAETDLLLAARTWDQAPEVDGMLYITSGKAAAGEIQPVKITGCHGTDLFGEIIE